MSKRTLIAVAIVSSAFALFVPESAGARDDAPDCNNDADMAATPSADVEQRELRNDWSVSETEMRSESAHAVGACASKHFRQPVADAHANG
jgi:hypothetical protein